MPNFLHAVLLYMTVFSFQNALFSFSCSHLLDNPFILSKIVATNATD